MTEFLNEFLADKATMLVEENFTGVRAEWWWERRLGGGIAVCQVLDPRAMSRQISDHTGRDQPEVQQKVEEELGLEDLEPVVLNFEMPGETSAPVAARMLQDRSSTSEGLAAGLYRQIEESIRATE
ncbi:hypothetical protein BH24ACT21_BH24ACT21_08700 [soil metagenome]|jgi:hypothetical protein